MKAELAVKFEEEGLVYRDRNNIGWVFARLHRFGREYQTVIIATTGIRAFTHYILGKLQ